MVWDLGRAMHKKQEFECARLIDFEFRLRARTMRLLAQDLGLPVDDLVGRIAEGPNEAILTDIADETGRTSDEVETLYQRLRGAARTQLIREIGDPTPHRLG